MNRILLLLVLGTMLPTVGHGGTCTLALAPISGNAQAGDILVTMRPSGYVLGINPSVGTFYVFGKASAEPDGITVDPVDPSRVQISLEALGQIETMDAFGNVVGTYATLAGGFPKIGSFGPDGSYYVAEQSGNRLWKVPAGGGAGSVMTLSGTLPNIPTQCTFDASGNMYVTSASNGSMIKYSAATLATASPFGTLLASGMDQVLGSVWDPAGYLYVTGWHPSGPTNTGTIWKIDASSGVTTQLTANFAPLAENGGGPLYFADGIIEDLDGNLWVMQDENPGAREGLLKIDPATGTPLAFYPIPASIAAVNLSGDIPDDLAVAGLSLPRPACPPTATPTPMPTAVPGPCPQILPQYTAVPYTGNGKPGDVLLSLRTAGRILGLNPTTETYYMFSTSTAGVGYLDGLTVDIADSNKLLVTMEILSVLKTVDSTGTVTGTYGSITGAPKIPAFNPSDGSLWVPDHANDGLWRIPAGGGSGVLVASGALFNNPTGSTFDNAGNFFVTNNGTGTILKCANPTSSPFSPTFTLFASGFLQLAGIVEGGDGYLYAVGQASAPPYNGIVYKVNAATGAWTVLTSAFAPLTENSGGLLYNPDGIVMDLDGYLWLVQRHGATNEIGGMLKIDPVTGTPLVYLAIPDSIDGYAGNSVSQPDDLCVLGMVLPRQPCVATATPTSSMTRTPSATVSPSATRTVTASPSMTVTVTLTYSDTPSQTATPSVTETFTAVVTVTPLPTSTVVADCHTQKAIKIPSNLLNGGRNSFNILVKPMETGKARLDIYHDGQLVRTLWSGELVKCGTRVLSWDLRDDQGNPVASGVYTAVFTDASGGLFKEKCAVVR